MTVEPSALQAALAPPRAYGTAPAPGQLRAIPEDFVVEEELGFEPAGKGQHLLLKVRKTNANTQWVARELARLASCNARDVGYAGLKDRRAVAVQWFSVPQPRKTIDWTALGAGSPPSGEFAVLEAYDHDRKLPRGALAGNRFAIRIRAPVGHGAALAALIATRLEALARGGVPNYFGPQRFGRDAANLARAGVGVDGLRQPERGFVISAARSALFNAVLAERVRGGSWNRLLVGDLANLDGRGSVFDVEAVDRSLEMRAESLELHPTGALWGKGSPQSRAAVLELEAGVTAQLPAQARLCESVGLRQERRSLRLVVRDLQCEREPAAVLLRFGLARGGFATSVLRELFDTAGAGGAEGE
ncbi:MAG: tRNA pseudouridine(13) synthase TruD [Gammaproteobacteria bacterium]|nr:tRNA pseudouridine(13) synthase TruD [Gammaproteobacteria bacterium]